jgi:hypothetical protein
VVIPGEAVRWPSGEENGIIETRCIVWGNKYHLFEIGQAKA